jgi:nitrogen-specific signal transduction histidine kinase
MALPATSIDKDDINLHEATEHVIDLFKFDSKNKMLSLKKIMILVSLDVSTNKEQLIQALINLVRNSIQALRP